MSISVHPVDGLINRLLEQHSSSSAVRHSGKAQQHTPSNAPEKVNISEHAKHVVADQSVSKLESHLLQLYSPHSI